MSRHKTVNIKRNSGQYKRSKNNNVLLLKITDPVVQCIIFIYFICCLDADAQGLPYRTVLLLLISWQYVSAIANLFYKDAKALRKERLMYLVVNTVYMALFFLLGKHVKELSFGFSEDDAQFHLYETLLMGGALVISFWYNVICYREVKSLLSGVMKDR